MHESQTLDSPQGTMKRFLTLGRQFFARIFGRKKARNPNIYPLY